MTANNYRFSGEPFDPALGKSFKAHFAAQ